MKVYLIQLKGTKEHANCLPIVFTKKENAERYHYEACYFPSEWEVIEKETED